MRDEFKSFNCASCGESTGFPCDMVHSAERVERHDFFRLFFSRGEQYTCPFCDYELFTLPTPKIDEFRTEAVIHTDGGAFVGGTVVTHGGDFVGRDKYISDASQKRTQNNIWKRNPDSKWAKDTFLFEGQRSWVPVAMRRDDVAKRHLVMYRSGEDKMYRGCYRDGFLLLFSVKSYQNGFMLYHQSNITMEDLSVGDGLVVRLADTGCLYGFVIH